MTEIDALVCGGGMVGLTQALALGKGGLQVAVVDALPPAQTTAPEFDGRVSALAYAAVRMMRALEVWPHLEAQAQPIGEILVSDGAVDRPASPFSLHFDAKEAGADSLGHIAENRHIRAALYAAIAAQKNITLIAPASVLSLAVEPGRKRNQGRAGDRRGRPRLAAADANGNRPCRLGLSANRHRRHGASCPAAQWRGV
jgi:2-octaprenyl-6-methoxyphenol hydroxylase